MISLRILEIQGYMDGGSCIHTLMLSKGLIENGFPVVLAAPPPQKSGIRSRLRQNGVPHEIVPLMGRYDWRSVTRLLQIIGHHKIDIVHTHCQNADFLGGLAARLARVPLLVTTLHGLLPTCDDLRRLAYVQTLRRLPHHLIAISESVRLRALAYGIPDGRITTVLNATDVEETRPTRSVQHVRALLNITCDDSLLLCVGVLEPSKGTDIAIRAMPIVIADHPSTQLVIVGDGSVMHDLKVLAHELGVASNVQFLGYRDDVYDLMNAADVVLNPSRTEGFGRVNTEAMALRKPVVCSDLSAFREVVVNGITGLLVPVGNSEAFASAISRLLASPEHRSNMGSAAWRRVNSMFSSDRFVSETLQVFRRLADMRHPNSRG